MTDSHTNGPWHLAGVKRQTQVRGGHDALSGGALIVATIYETHDGSKDGNAKLISAAPDMLAALRACESILLSSYDLAELNKTLWLLRTAITKATGP